MAKYHNSMAGNAENVGSRNVFVRKGAEALESALSSHCRKASEIGRIIVATSASSPPFPSVAAQLAYLFGMGKVPGYDIYGSDSLESALAIADSYALSGDKMPVAVVDVRKESKGEAYLFFGQKENNPPQQYASLFSSGIHLPEQILTNDTIARRIVRPTRKEQDEITPEWIFGRCGVRERRIAQDWETLAYMGEKALEKSLLSAGIGYSHLDGIIVSTSHPNPPEPSIAESIASKLGISGAFCCDLRAGCAGSCYGIEVANSIISSGKGRVIAVIASERMRDMIPMEEKNTTILFGDASAALVLGASKEPGIIASVSGTDGSLSGLIRMQDEKYATMNGFGVFNFAVSSVPGILKALVIHSGMALDSIKLFILHQANQRITQAVSERLGLDGRMMSNITYYGNTSTASVPICVYEAVRDRIVGNGDVIATLSFGSGMSWAGHVIKLNDRLAFNAKIYKH